MDEYGVGRFATEEEHIGDYYYKAACSNLHDQLNRFCKQRVLLCL